MRVFVVVLIALCHDSIAQSLQEYYSQAKDAYQKKDYALFYTNISEAHRIHPYHQGILYYKGLAAALTNKPDEAVECLRKAILISDAYNLNIDDLKSLQSRKDFLALLEYQREVKKPIIHSDTVLILPDRELHAEVAFDSKNNAFYIASIHKRKIVKIDSKHTITDFAETAANGLTAVMALEVNEASNTLWASSSPMPEMMNYDSTSQSALYEYDLKTGQLRDSYTPDHPAKEFVLGDLTLNKKGELFVSDTKNNIIFTLDPKTKKLVPFFTSEEFWNIQGITFSEDDRYLFISDYIKGIYRLELATKSLTVVKCGLDVSLKGVDGLLYYKYSLIALQNGVSPFRAMRYMLNQDASEIISYEVIDRAHPAFNEPINGCIVNNVLYYVANSQWSAYDENHNLKPSEQLQPIVILKKVLE